MSPRTHPNDEPARVSAAVQAASEAIRPLIDPYVERTDDDVEGRVARAAVEAARPFIVEEIADKLDERGQVDERNAAYMVRSLGAVDSGTPGPLKDGDHVHVSANGNLILSRVVRAGDVVTIQAEPDR